MRSRKGKQRKGKLSALRRVSQPKEQADPEKAERAAERFARRVAKLAEEKKPKEVASAKKGRACSSKRSQRESCKFEKEALGGGSIGGEHQQIRQQSQSFRPLGWRTGATSTVISAPACCEQDEYRWRVGFEVEEVMQLVQEQIGSISARPPQLLQPLKKQSNFPITNGVGKRRYDNLLGVQQQQAGSLRIRHFFERAFMAKSPY